MASATSLVDCTASIRGFRMILFSRTAINLEGVSGVASSTALTASTPCKVDNCRSYAHALPPLCTCPRVVIRVSSFNVLDKRSLTLFGDILFRSRSCAPSATITIVFRFPSLRCCNAVSENYIRVTPASNLRDDIAHIIFPVSVGWTLGNKDEICSCAHSSHQGKPPAMPSHDLNHKSPLM